ncbi:MAG: hypothetical protein HY906_13545 [Deltaproteobacteria bacterium]|nr:hypothetical protein [Deltaproteobacteria bacterium]
MRQPIARLVALAALVGGAALFGCGGGHGGDPDGGKQHDAAPGDAPPIAKLVWRQVKVDDQNAGHQPELVRAPDGSLGVAYYRMTGAVDQCTRVDPPAPVNRYEIVYAYEKSDGTFAKEVAATVNLLNLQGVALAYDAAGNAGIAYMGGTEAAYRCGGTDAMLARRTGPNAWTATTIAVDGNDDPVFSEDTAQCAAYQDTCHVGDVVGTWPSLAFSGADPWVVFQDVHFGFAQDDFEKADMELSQGGSRMDLDSVRGAGQYARILVEEDGNPSVAHYSPFANSGGIWQTWKDASGWHRQRIVPRMSIGYRLGYARAGGKHGVAYYPPFQNNQSVEQKLWYLESIENNVWGTAEVVDAAGDTGKSPSLAFDGLGRPAIAYYRCREQYDPNNRDCEQASDGVMIAVKESAWVSKLVWNDQGVYDGLYVSLAYDQDGLPAIAYQASSLDTGTSPPTVINELIVARSKVQ